jgi:hypothetical protein
MFRTSWVMRNKGIPDHYDTPLWKNAQLLWYRDSSPLQKLVLSLRRSAPVQNDKNLSVFPGSIIFPRKNFLLTFLGLHDIVTPNENLDADYHHNYHYPE